MATIFTINNDNELEEVTQIFGGQYDHRKHIFSVENKLSWSKFEITNLKLKNVGSDIFSTNDYYETTPHWHYGAEERLILSGTGRFYIPTENEMYVIDVESGDLIWLSPCLQHWFETDSIMAARFFSEDNAHIEHKNNISYEVTNWHALYNQGFKPRL